MRPDDRDLDDEIRGHLAISVQERIDRGEDPVAARLAALEEFGYIPEMRESMRRVWYSRWFDAVAALVQDMRVGLRSLLRAKGLAATVVVTLALGIGANAAIFSVVRGVLLRPLVNRGEDRLIYIRQSAPGISRNLTFSVPEIRDFGSRTSTISAFGEFSTVDFTMIGFGEPRVVQAGVVNGAFFDVMGLRPVLGRLIDTSDDGLNAPGVAVLTHRFWTTSLNSDPTVIGKAIGLGARTATVIGVLEPSVPYPDDTEIIANMITSPHHFGAMMVTQRSHRMTELFGRLAPDASVESARAELTAVHAAIRDEHFESYSTKGDIQLTVKPLRDQITSPARPVLLVLLAAAGIVFIIACSNVANLILARSVRREGELAVRAALGASRGALRRTLLAESLVLCGAGAVLGVVLARPFVAVVARFAARFSVRALDVTVDPELALGGRQPGDGGGGAARLRPPAAFDGLVCRIHAFLGEALTHQRERRRAEGIRVGERQRSHDARHEPAVARVRHDANCVLLRVARRRGHARCRVDRPSDRQHRVRHTARPGDRSPAAVTRLQHARRDGVLSGGVAPGWRIAWSGSRGAGQLRAVARLRRHVRRVGSVRGRRVYARGRRRRPTRTAEDRVAGFFDTLGVPIVAGRDFTADDRQGSEHVVIVSQALAERLFPNADALNRKVWWTDPYFGRPLPQRIVGVVASVDDVDIARAPALAIYHPCLQFGHSGRLFVRAAGDPYALVQPVTRVIREMSANQPVERAATLEDIRADVLAPERLNAFVFSGFAGVALLIAVVGVAGVLAFGVSARTREFGVRLAIGSTPSDLLMTVLGEGATIVAIGITAGAVGGYVFAGIASRYLESLQICRCIAALRSSRCPRRRRDRRLADARRARIARRRAAGAAIGVAGADQGAGRA